MKSRWAGQILPSVILIAVISGVALAKTILGSLGFWSDVGRSHVGLSSYRALAKPLKSALALSLELATVSTLAAAVFGIILAYLIHTRNKYSNILMVATGIIVITPHLVSAVAINLLLGDAGTLSRFWHPISKFWPQFVAGAQWLAVIFDVAWKESAFIALVLIAALPIYMEEMKEVAKTLGARPFRLITKVLFPTTKHALVISSGLAFIYSVESYEAAWLLGRTYPEPLSVMTFRLFSNSDLAVRPQAYASAVVSIALIALAAIAMSVMIPRKLRT